MLQRVVVVVPPSPFKETPCWRCQTIQTSLAPVCSSCQALQDIPEAGLNFFSALGYSPTLKIDDEELRHRFYNISKLTHPDRFVNVPAPEKGYSERWSAYLNKAHQTLRDTKKRAEYLLELFQVPPPKTNKIPTDLAESYFELQELLMEQEGRNRLIQFRNSLSDQIDKAELEMDKLAEVWIKTNAKEQFLLHLQEHLNKLRYLYSMITDLERKLGTTSGNSWN